MTRAPSPLADLLTVCDSQGIRLLLADDGALTIDAPQDVLTPDLLDRLKAHKGELLTLLRKVPLTMPGVSNAEKRTPRMPPELRRRVGANPDTWQNIDPAIAAEEICRCGSITWRDVPIHSGRSIRRDCGRCGRFIDFPIWYGKPTRQKG